ncbi:hypothetical protein FRZ06_09160 [Anoxybacterium hadale]|uniref:Uncharacterized protein n=1 Tax=Anoxybacterium hadale TaxID=3408580 RepID=A0ACD1AAS6_9FIRM|nr:hypothetical protein FRZ06_09160 [Clostridiales bacterium]
MGKPATNPVIDRRIAEVLQDKAREAVVPEFLLDRIHAEINEKEKGYCEMNKGFFKGMGIKGMKPVVVASLIVILTAATSFAATQISSLVSTSKDVFDEFPTAKQVEKAVNYVPNYVDSFSNGFYFKDASVSSTKALDGDKNTVNAYEGINFNYTKDGASKEQYISLSADPKTEGINDTELGMNEETVSLGDMDLIYSKVTFKVTPEGYIPTAEEQKLVDQEKMWLSEGSEKVEVTEVQYLRWMQDGISYNLMDNGFAVDKDDFINMAKEIIAD